MSNKCLLFNDFEMIKNNKRCRQQKNTNNWCIIIQLFSFIIYIMLPGYTFCLLVCTSGLRNLIFMKCFIFCQMQFKSAAKKRYNTGKRNKKKQRKGSYKCYMYMYMYFKKDQIYPYKAVQKNPQNNSDTINDRDYEVI